MFRYRPDRRALHRRVGMSFTAARDVHLEALPDEMTAAQAQQVMRDHVACATDCCEHRRRAHGVLVHHGVYVLADKR
jgi:hypothetical protein